MNRYQNNQTMSAHLLAEVLKIAYPTVCETAIEFIAKNAVVAADTAVRMYWAQTHTGAMHGEAMANIVPTDALLLDHAWEEVEL